jgi:ComF family protein
VPFAGEGPSHPCPRCLEDPPPFAALRAWGLYRGPLLDAIHRFKYRRDLAYRRTLEALIAEAHEREFGERRFSAVVPVPCHLATLRRRGFDLPALLARRVGRLARIPWRPRALAKVRATPDLVGLGAEERARAVKGAFAAREPLGGDVLLVDDVATSTATARACGQACLEGGAERVWVLVLARTPLDAARR